MANTQQSNEPSFFEKATAVMEVIGLFATGGGCISTQEIMIETEQTSAIVQEIESNVCSLETHQSSQDEYENLPEIAKVSPLEDQLENWTEIVEENKKEEYEKELEISTLEANQPSISAPPPESESEYDDSEIVSFAISLIDENETEYQSQETENSFNSETESEGNESDDSESDGGESEG